ncbi:hypothetical protein ICW40_05720 [Actinotalea ferrariae]|uniref:hypothetical protein n=1 Tax=Actinotalea ferrariae TaxID=1386098 RepID=UPI001C8BCAD0|nr:hypothetical protein [Actinotalea ferrariae]MBX9244304.1 hypothetical protein [Actinotalea ferrariae]
MALTLIVVTGLLVVAVRSARCNFRQWRATRHLPLIVASEEALTAHLEAWDWGRRWPDPGRPGRWNLSVVQCRSYARLAATRGQALRPVTVVLGVVAGVLIAEWWPGIVAAWKVISAPVDPQESFAAVTRWGEVFSGAGAPLVLAMVVLALVGQLETASLEAQELTAAYQWAADRQEAAALVAVSPPAAERGLPWSRRWGRVRSALQRGPGRVRASETGRPT